METAVVKVPPKFYEDHRARDCGETGIVLGEYKHHTTVQLDSESFHDLLSDARYYGWGLGEDHSVDGGLISSARSTWKKLQPLLHIFPYDTETGRKWHGQES